jgi:histidinol-phosphate aminotransferase
MARTARDLGLEALPSGTNFMALRMRDADQSQRVVRALEAQDIFVRRPSIAPLDTLVRFTLGTATQRAHLERALRDAL